jgi:hypothetical protein
MADEQHTTTTASWPTILQQLARILGPELTMRLADEHGGATYAYVSKDPQKPHRWRSVVVDDAQWASVVAELGGNRWHLPRGKHLNPKKVQIIELAEQGLTAAEITRRLHASERYVRRLLGALRATPATVRTAPAKRPPRPRTAPPATPAPAPATRRERRRRRAAGEGQLDLWPPRR